MQLPSSLHIVQVKDITYIKTRGDQLLVNSSNPYIYIYICRTEDTNRHDQYAIAVAAKRQRIFSFYQKEISYITGKVSWLPINNESTKKQSIKSIKLFHLK